MIKFGKEVKSDQIEAYQQIVTVNKVNVKKAQKIEEMKEKDDPNMFYRNFLKNGGN